MSVEERLKKALELLSDMVQQADEDCPADCRTRHFKDTMCECVDLLVAEKLWEEH